jgi:hypothetical protein
MAGSLQAFLVKATEEAAKELETAYLRIPEDKRHWCPMGQARTAGDLVAECGILNDIEDMVRNRKFPEGMDWESYGLSIEFPSPWGSLSIEQTIAYPYWNMSYHLGQLNYIASMLGCLE